MNRARFLATILFAAGTAGAAVDDPVRLDTGMISGAATDSPEVRVFKGIPYAAPPVGDLRWRAPKPAAPWEGTRKADEFGPVCMQGGGQKMSEDCLYLNVWTGAKTASEKRPVFFQSYFDKRAAR
jgi:para-nitrobenzyl esterase